MTKRRRYLPVIFDQLPVKGKFSRVSLGKPTCRSSRKTAHRCSIMDLLQTSARAKRKVLSLRKMAQKHDQRIGKVSNAFLTLQSAREIRVVLSFLITGEHFVRRNVPSNPYALGCYEIINMADAYPPKHT